MGIVDIDNVFWIRLEELLSKSKIVVDRPRGSVHPRYPQIVYELETTVILMAQSLQTMRE